MNSLCIGYEYEGITNTQRDTCVHYILEPYCVYMYMSLEIRLAVHSEFTARS